MKLTQEQIDIINSTGNIRINAVAGSGKTTTIIEYARTRPKDSKILYLAFNKSVKLEAQRKFLEKGLKNVQIETAHSLAYKHVVFKHKYNIRIAGYKTHEIADLLGLSGGEEAHTEYILANHILRFITYYCNSDKTDIAQLNYREVVRDSKALKFVNSFYGYILNKASDLLKKMDAGEIDITHDFYLKKFQLSSPTLKYDYILFDEGQDASAAMLDIFLKQAATKVIVGDTHQQIYGWRHAVNSLEKTDFTDHFLTTSFRFPQSIADLAVKMLDLKVKLKPAFQSINMTGSGNSSTGDSKAIIARTNLGLLRRAIDHVSSGIPLDRLYFEGNIYSYTYADDGASLYDVLNLYNRKTYMIRDALIKKMKSISELEEYIEKTEDIQLKMMVEIVQDYGNEIPGILKRLKEKHVDNESRDKAEIIFSTVHRCKGMEYDEVELVNDFINEVKLDKSIGDAKNNPLDIPKLNEEINLLYVAVTRAKKLLKINYDMMPKNFPESPNICVQKDDFVIDDSEAELILQEKSYFDILEQKNTGHSPSSTYNYQLLEEIRKSRGLRGRSNRKSGNEAGEWTIQQFRRSQKNFNKRWKKEDDEELIKMHESGYTEKEMAEYFERTTGAIYCRLVKLLPEEFGK